jgi:alpha-L-arabinofuranosidase
MPKFSLQCRAFFFEDINFGADGGIYEELVKNRSFEFSKP